MTPRAERFDSSAASDPVLSVVLPMWNEEESATQTLDTWCVALAELEATARIAGWEIVAVDDGSTDDTAAVVEAVSACEPRVRLVAHAANRGLGAGVRTGLGAASGDVVLYTDADLPFDPRRTAAALELMASSGADIVAGYRNSRRGEGPRRFVYSYVYNSLVRLVLDLKVRDVNFALKLMRRRVVDAIDLSSEGSFIDAELLASARRQGFTIRQLGMDYVPRSRGTSTLSSVPVVIGIVREMVRLTPAIRRLGPLVPEPGR